MCKYVLGGAFGRSSLMCWVCALKRHTGEWITIENDGSADRTLGMISDAVCDTAPRQALDSHRICIRKFVYTRGNNKNIDMNTNTCGNSQSEGERIRVLESLQQVAVMTR